MYMCIVFKFIYLNSFHAHNCSYLNRSTSSSENPPPGSYTTVRRKTSDMSPVWVASIQSKQPFLFMIPLYLSGERLRLPIANSTLRIHSNSRSCPVISIVASQWAEATNRYCPEISRNTLQPQPCSPRL